MKTPYETAKESGMKSIWESPDGFSKIETFENGQRFLHNPIHNRPVQMRYDRGMAEEWHHKMSLIAALGDHGQG